MPPGSIRRCPSCGALLDPDEVFCSRCGAKIGAAEEAPIPRSLAPLPPLEDGIPGPRSISLWAVATAVMEFLFMGIMSTIWYGLLALDLRRHSQAKLDASPPLSYRVWPRALAMLLPLITTFALASLMVILLIPVILSLPDPTDVAAVMEAIMPIAMMFEGWIAVAIVVSSLPRWAVMHLLARDMKSHLAQAGGQKAEGEDQQLLATRIHASLWLLLYAATFSFQLLQLIPPIIPALTHTISIATSATQILSVIFLVLYFYDLQSKLNQHSHYHAEAALPYY